MARSHACQLRQLVAQLGQRMGRKGGPSGRRSSSSAAAARRSRGLNRRMPNRISVLLIPVDDPGLLAHQLVAGPPGRRHPPPQRRDRHHLAMLGLAPQPAQKSPQQQLGVEPIRLGGADARADTATLAAWMT